MSNLKLFMLTTILFLLNGVEPVAAQALQGEIRLQPSKQDAIWVGEQVELNLDLLTNGFSFSGQQFRLPEVDGAYLLQADSTTIKLSERRGDETWQGLRYTILVYPQKPGSIEIPSFSVEFSASAGYGKDVTSFALETTPQVIEVALPPGANPAGLVVTTTRFSMKYGWNPTISDDGVLSLKTGDALTLSVERQADSVPGMVFSPLPSLGFEGLRAYPGSSGVNDRVNRGELQGVRTDSITFICEREGTYEIPPVTFQWWDPVREQMNEEIIPGVNLDVVVNPVYQQQEDSAATGSLVSINPWTVLGVIALLLASGLVIWKLADPVEKWIKAEKQKRRAGAGWAFRQALVACKGNQAIEAYSAINLWLNRQERGTHGKTMLVLARELGWPELVAELENLQSVIATGDTRDWKGHELARQLKRWIDENGRRKKQEAALPPLNPTP